METFDYENHVNNHHLAQDISLKHAMYLGNLESRLKASSFQHSGIMTHFTPPPSFPTPLAAALPQEKPTLQQVSTYVRSMNELSTFDLTLMMKSTEKEREMPGSNVEAKSSKSKVLRRYFFSHGAFSGSLDLSRNGLMDDDIPALIELFSQVGNIRRLSLAGNDFSPQGIQKVLQAL